MRRLLLGKILLYATPGTDINYFVFPLNFCKNPKFTKFGKSSEEIGQNLIKIIIRLPRRNVTENL